VAQRIKAETNARDRQYHKHHDALREEENGYMQEIDAFLDYRKQSAVEKKMEVFERWDKEVFSKIQADVSEQLRGVSTAELSSKKRAHYQAYLDMMEKRGGTLYRDIVIKSEYDPFPAQTKTWSRSFSVRELEEHDPCHSILTKAGRERYVGEMSDRHLDESNIQDDHLQDRFNDFPAEKWHKQEGTMYRDWKPKALKKSATVNGSIAMEHYVPGPKDAASKEWVRSNGRGMRHGPEITAAHDKGRQQPLITFKDDGPPRRTRTGRFQPVQTGPAPKYRQVLLPRPNN
jgi:hypothetical protein